MARNVYTVSSASNRSFVSREFTGLTLAAAKEIIADETANGWTAWISETTPAAEYEAEMEAARIERAAAAERMMIAKGERAWKALRAAEARMAEKV